MAASLSLSLISMCLSLQQVCHPRRVFFLKLKKKEEQICCSLTLAAPLTLNATLLHAVWDSRRVSPHIAAQLPHHQAKQLPSSPPTPTTMTTHIDFTQGLWGS